MARITLKYCNVEQKDFGITTCFQDGTYVNGCPHDTSHYRLIAHRLGYDDNIFLFCMEHDLLHSWIAEHLSDSHSVIMWGLAHGRDVHPLIAAQEELLIQAAQGWIRANQRPIVSGIDWDHLKVEALRMLDKFYSHNS